ncbi:hypothetical protein PQI64_11315 [Shewanella bicestrii]
MIPETGWSDDNQLKEYATYGIGKPQYNSENPFEIELGPEQLNSSGGNIKAAWWLFEYTGNDVTASKYNGNIFESAISVFLVNNIKRLAATFDQLGRPMVFFETTDNKLKLYWFDPVLVKNIITQFGDGNYPYATFDIRWDTSNPRSDVMLFYMRSGAIYYRLQRDRYAIEYATPVTADAAFIKEADMAVDYRLQLLYSYRDTGFTPPEPMPPAVPPASGRFSYLLTGYQSAIELTQAGAFTLELPFSVAFDLENYAYLNVQSTLFSYGNQGQNPIVSVGFSGLDMDILEVRYFGFKHVKKLDFGLQDGHWLIEFYRVDGVGFNHALRVSCQPKGSATTLTYEYLLLSPTLSSIGQFVRIGNRASYGEQIFTVPGDFSSSFTTRNEYAFGLRGVISNIELHTAIAGAPVIKLPMIKAQGESQLLLDAADVPLPLPNAQINDYKDANWAFIKS